jgi:hypothetical protein
MKNETYLLSTKTITYDYWNTMRGMYYGSNIEKHEPRIYSLKDCYIDILKYEK